MTQRFQIAELALLLTQTSWIIASSEANWTADEDFKRFRIIALAVNILSIGALVASEKLSAAKVPAAALCILSTGTCAAIAAKRRGISPHLGYGISFLSLAAGVSLLMRRCPSNKLVIVF